MKVSLSYGGKTLTIFLQNQFKGKYGDDFTWIATVTILL